MLHSYTSIAPIPAKRQAWPFCGVILLLITACARLPPPTPFVPPPPSTPPFSLSARAETALPQLILAERAASRSGDLAQLGQLWAEEARVVDGRNTTDTDDDYIWSGRPAVLDRYVVAVFPNPPPPLVTLEGLDIQLSGDEATAIYGQDRWRFVRRDGRWWIVELIYSQPNSD